jgi:hypothetical protein
MSKKMKHRIRAAGFVLQNDHILLVRLQDPNNGTEIGVTSGGGLIAADSSIFDAAKQKFSETRYTESASETSKFMFGYASEKKKIGC